MSDLSERLKNLTPEQRKLLEMRMKKKGGTAPAKAAEPEIKAKNDNKKRTLDFSLYFFSDDGEGMGSNKYDLLLNTVKYADANGYNAVWTPERHFQTFGGLYPNPSVLGAALSTITENVRIRCGSVVVPLHHPIRIAEEWGVVDNLSNGRVDISFATGWHRHDYVIRPENFEPRRKVMFEDIEKIRKLWRGEEVFFAGVDGEETGVKTVPRPVQKELNYWITAASPHTFGQTGELGGNILTMLGGGVEILGANIANYRKARLENGHDPRKGVVTLMLHTYLGHDNDKVKEESREPMYRYLGNYINQFANLPGAPQVDNTEGMLEFAFERYFSSSSLLGTPDKVRGLLQELADIGVNEIACLIDFGVPGESVMQGLELLTELKKEFAAE